MARGGARPGAGRKAGSATKRTREIADRATADGVTPLEVMLAIMRGAVGKDNEVALEAAKAAAPYVHPRLSSIEASGKDGGPLVVEVVRFADPASE